MAPRLLDDAYGKTVATVDMESLAIKALDAWHHVVDRDHPVGARAWRGRFDSLAAVAADVLGMWPTPAAFEIDVAEVYRDAGQVPPMTSGNYRSWWVGAVASLLRRVPS